MKKLKTFAPVLLTVLIVIFGNIALVNHVFAGDNKFSGPTSAFPSCDRSNPACNPPINVSKVAQIKDGDLGVNAFLAEANARFAQKVFFDQQADKGYTSGGVSYDTGLCTDTKGAVEACGDAQNSPQVWTTSGVEKGNDLIEVTLTLNSQQAGTNQNGDSSWAKWTISNEKVLMSSNPAHVVNPLPMHIYTANSSFGGGSGCSNTVDKMGEGTMDGTGRYHICLGQETGGGAGAPSMIGMNYNVISIMPIISSGGSPNVKLVPFSTGNNEITFTASDDASLNNLYPGDKVVIMYMANAR